MWGLPIVIAALSGPRSSIVLNRGSTPSVKVKEISDGGVAISLPTGGLACSRNAWADGWRRRQQHHQPKQTEPSHQCHQSTIGLPRLVGKRSSK